MQESRDADPIDQPPPAQSSSHGSPDDGVDASLIRWMLSLTPEERLRTLENTIRSILRLRTDRNQPDLFHLLQVLAEHHVDFIVIDGVGAVLQGAPIATFDLKDLAVLPVLRRALREWG